MTKIAFSEVIWMRPAIAHIVDVDATAKGK